VQSDVSRTNWVGQSGVNTGLRKPRAKSAKAGGGRRDRTDDLMLAKHALSQLSYAPVTGKTKRARAGKVVGLGRLELPTSRLSSARSNQLSYKPSTLKEACDA
jgi:hypothetical protein